MNPNSTHNTSMNDDEISIKELFLMLKEWWGYLLSKWLIILIAGMIGGGLGFVYASLQTPTYTSEYTFVFEDGGNNSANQFSGFASMVGLNFGNSGSGGLFRGDNLLELYKSRRMIEKALLTEIEYNDNKQTLIEIYINVNKLRDQWNDNPDLKNIQFLLEPGQESFTRLQDSIISSIVSDINKNYLKVGGSEKNASLIKAEVKSKDEIFAKGFNEQIVKTVNDFYIHTKSKKSLENIKVLQYQADSIRKIMERSVYLSASAIDATPNLNPSKQVLRTATQLSQFEVETNKAILSELIKNLEMSKMSLLNETPLIQVVDIPTLPLEKSYISKVKCILYGGILFVFLVVIYFLGRLSITMLIKE